MGLMSKARGLGLGVIIWTLAIPIFLFTIFPLVSSTSTGTSGIYLLTYKWNSDEHEWLRLGYYGMCIVGGKHKDWCVTTTGRSGKDLAKAFNIDTKYAPDFDYPRKLQRDVFVAFLTAGGVVWFISLILITFVILRGSSAGRLIRSAAKTTSLAGATLMVASAWATNSAVRALEVASTNSIKGGNLLYGLQWVAAVLAFIYAYVVSSVADSEDGGKAHYLGRGV
ncbi:hypothetical protein M438DRAFT_351597 [Aureobasidium pullulans EXF-150]|uniref:SUR7-domain-containing protein n=1 Tax=Aureobasidium pullulans EXF-150 TaxID=1043002 RepID=A0A074XRQ8_AURPU|nr:uncharacterized protein M438DRAFT_351597 [Aureobasidium pullulans EXF-150]KEQ88308.1 hypothetical protein M438DRAFT_351597 [Aureobasidium pullulans EXF-150]